MKLRQLAIVIFVVTALVLTSGVASAQPQLQDSYGSLAYAQSISVYAQYFAPSKEQAFHGALSNCVSTGFPNYHNDCLTAVWVHNGWIAIAYDGSGQPNTRSGAWGTGWGHTQQLAENDAVRICKGYGGVDCTVRGSYKTYVYDPNAPTVGGPGEPIPWDCNHLFVPAVALYGGKNYSPPEICFESAGRVNLGDYGWSNRAESVNVGVQSGCFYDSAGTSWCFSGSFEKGDLGGWNNRIVAIEMS